MYKRKSSRIKYMEKGKQHNNSEPVSELNKHIKWVMCFNKFFININYEFMNY